MKSNQKIVSRLSTLVQGTYFKIPRLHWHTYCGSYLQTTARSEPPAHRQCYFKWEETEVRAEHPTTPQGTETGIRECLMTTWVPPGALERPATCRRSVAPGVPRGGTWSGLRPSGHCTLSTDRSQGPERQLRCVVREGEGVCVSVLRKSHCRSTTDLEQHGSELCGFTYMGIFFQ